MTSSWQADEEAIEQRRKLDEIQEKDEEEALIPLKLAEQEVEKAEQEVKRLKSDLMGEDKFGPGAEEMQMCAAVTFSCVHNSA